MSESPRPSDSVRSRIARATFRFVRHADRSALGEIQGLIRAIALHRAPELEEHRKGFERRAHRPITVEDCEELLKLSATKYRQKTGQSLGDINRVVVPGSKQTVARLLEEFGPFGSDAGPDA